MSRRKWGRLLLETEKAVKRQAQVIHRLESQVRDYTLLLQNTLLGVPEVFCADSEEIDVTCSNWDYIASANHSQCEQVHPWRVELKSRGERITDCMQRCYYIIRLSHVLEAIFGQKHIVQLIMGRHGYLAFVDLADLLAPDEKDLEFLESC